MICIVNMKHYSSDLAERDIVHNTLLALHALQLYRRNLHQESVFITIKFQKIIVKFSCDALLVSSIQVPGERDEVNIK